MSLLVTCYHMLFFYDKIYYFMYNNNIQKTWSDANFYWFCKKNKIKYVAYLIT